MTTVLSQSAVQEQPSIDKWFEEYVSEIVGHGYMVSTGTAPDELQRFYMSAIEGDILGLLTETYRSANMKASRLMVTDLLPRLKDIPAITIGLHYEGTAIIQLFAVVFDNDEESRHAIIASCATTEGKFHEFPIRFTTVIFEEEDGMELPTTYVKIK